MLEEEKKEERLLLWLVMVQMGMDYDYMKYCLHWSHKQYFHAYQYIYGWDISRYCIDL